VRSIAIILSVVAIAFLGMGLMCALGWIMVSVIEHIG
jgi:hypothetical protein